MSRCPGPADIARRPCVRPAILGPFASRRCMDGSTTARTARRLSSMITPFNIVARGRALLVLVALTCCAGLNSQTYSFATLDEARRAGAIANGWVPEGLPPSSHDIRVAQVPKTSQRWGIINFPRSEESSLRGLLQAEEAPLGGEHCDMPGRIEWWPVVLARRARRQSRRRYGVEGVSVENRRAAVCGELESGAGLLLAGPLTCHVPRATSDMVRATSDVSRL